MYHGAVDHVPQAESKTWGNRCVDAFELLAQVGQGTYGQVYKAKNLQTGMSSEMTRCAHVMCFL